MSDNENDSNRDVSIRKRTSLVWQYFEKLSSVRVKCRICQHQQRYMGNTANALRHLKVKHEIDARICGLEDPANVRRMKALSVSSATLEQTIAAVKKEHNITLKYNAEDEEDPDDPDGSGDPHEGKGRKSSNNRLLAISDDIHEGRGRKSANNRHYTISHYDEETEVDPYSAGNETLVDFVDTDNVSQVDVKHLVTSSPTNQYVANNNRSETKRKRTSLEEKRIMAETDYYREKAGYFRVQKHLAALQAKKVKYELEQLYGK